MYLANPTKITNILKFCLKYAYLLAILSVISFIYCAFYLSPSDYQQGETVRIMYIHVPAAYMAVFIYGAMACMAIFYLVWRHETAFCAIEALLPIGWVFTTICLITGSLWGKPMWGTYWVWDARLTSVFILWILYIISLMLRHSFDSREAMKKPLSIIILVGALNIPIIKFSVEWWNSLHQGASLMRLDGPSMDINMFYALLNGILLFNLLTFIIFAWRLMVIFAEHKQKKWNIRHES